jgi:hypothetical protein
MDFREEIAKHVKALSPEMQERVLRFATSLCTSTPNGESGAALRRFAFSLDSDSAREVIQAIEEECLQKKIGAGEAG